MTENKPKIVVRVEKSGEYKGTVLGVYADKSLEQGVDRQDGHFMVKHEWVLKSTRPASAEEEATFCEWYEPRYGECELVKRRY